MFVSKCLYLCVSLAKLGYAAKTKTLQCMWYAKIKFYLVLLLICSSQVDPVHVSSKDLERWSGYYLNVASICQEEIKERERELWRILNQQLNAPVKVTASLVCQRLSWFNTGSSTSWETLHSQGWLVIALAPTWHIPFLFTTQCLEPATWRFPITKRWGHYNLKMWPAIFAMFWLGSSLALSVSQIYQGFKFDLWSRYIQEPTNEYIDNWNNK